VFTHYFSYSQYMSRLSPLSGSAVLVDEVVVRGRREIGVGT
jgi:hypothetical protein